MNKLNDEQKAIADEIFKFLLDSSQKELIISGPGGSGKTYLMGHIVDNIIPSYKETCSLVGVTPEFEDVVMTAMTNKSAEVLATVLRREVKTIHSFLRLTVKNDYSTGVTRLVKRPDAIVHTNTILFIDEASAIDRALLNIIRETTHKCKIIYVCDNKQTGPIFEVTSPIFSEGIQEHTLTKVERNKGQPALQDLCSQARETVDTLDFKPIHVVPGVIEHLSPSEMEKKLVEVFLNTGSDARILAYTNARVTLYNQFIREIKGYTQPYEIGEKLVNSSAININKQNSLRTEEEVVVRKVSAPQTIPIKNGINIDVLELTVSNIYGDLINILVPQDKDFYNSLLKYYKGQKDWFCFFKLKENIADLRPCEAITIHKAQGSTYNTVFIDCADLGTCKNPLLAARLLYVAVSRPTTKIYLYGEMPEKFGGIVK